MPSGAWKSTGTAYVGLTGMVAWLKEKATCDGELFEALPGTVRYSWIRHRGPKEIEEKEKEKEEKNKSQ